jgi:low temperature requirement protein LtrA
MLVLARTPLLREHFGVQFAWLLATGVLLCLGAAASPDNRLAWWVAAAAIDLTGSWTAHRLPWRRLQSRAVEISPDHMVERSRLLLIIALGEAILATGTAIAGAEAAILTTVSGALALTCVALLWAIYFAGSDRLVSEKASTTDDPLGLARIAVNSQLLNLASLIAVAVATDLAIAAPTTVSGTALVLLLFGGLWIFIATQSWYLRRLTGRHSPARLAVLAAIPVVGALCSAAPAWATLTAAAASLGGLALAMLVGSRRPDQLTPAAG